MEVNANITTVEKVELSKSTQNSVMFQRFEEITGWKMPLNGYHGYKVIDGFVYEAWEENYGHNSETEEKEIRKASNTDHALHMVANMLKNEANK